MRRLAAALGILSVLVFIGVNYTSCEPVGGKSGAPLASAQGGSTIAGNPFSGLHIAALPAVFLNSDYPVLPPGHHVITVGTTGRDYNDCQAAVNAAVPGDEIVIDAGFVCSPITLPDKGATSTFIVIRSANLEQLPEGRRVTHADSANMAVVEVNGSGYAVGTAMLPANSMAITAPGFYYFAGVELRVAQSFSSENYYLVKLSNGGTSYAQLPHDIVFSRCWIHGYANQEVRTGIVLNGLRVSLTDSIIDDIHIHNALSEGIIGWDAGAGPYKITNNEIAAAGDALVFGWPSSITNLIPGDMEIRKNYFHKDPAWRQPVTSNAGLTGTWYLEDMIVLKSAQRVLFDGNIFENDWVQVHPNSGGTHWGHAIEFAPTSYNQTWVRVQDITVQNNIFRSVGGLAYLVYQDVTTPGVGVARVQFQNNIGYNFDPANTYGVIYLSRQSQGPVAFDHNTLLSNAGQGPELLMAESQGLFSDFTFTNNLTNNETGGFTGPGLTNGAAVLNVRFPGVTFTGNALAGQNASDYGTFAAANYFPANMSAVGFTVDPTAGVTDYRDLALSPSSPYHGVAPLNTDVGAIPPVVTSALP